MKPYPFLVHSRSHAFATPLSSYNVASLPSYISNAASLPSYTAASLPTCGAMPHYHSCGILLLVQRNSERPKLSFRLYCSSLSSCGIGAILYCGIVAIFYIGCDVRSHYAARRRALVLYCSSLSSCGNDRRLSFNAAFVAVLHS